jgi:two-component system chemotaxis response regulator CheB
MIAASAGGLVALKQLLARIPSDFPAAIAIVQHRGPEHPERLVRLLAGSTRLKVCHAHDGVILEAGTVYVCPPRLHMTAEHCARLIEGPKIRFVQPSADLALESVARTYGDRAIAVVLSGAGTDGALGSLAMMRAGGVVLAQDEHTCGFSGMPRTAQSTGAVDQVLSPAELAPALQHWAAGHWPAAQHGAAGEQRIKVLIVDDHRIILDGLRVLLDAEPDMTVVAAAEDGAIAVRQAREHAPDVIVMDIRMPGFDGVEATRQILACVPSAKVLALSADTATDSVNGIFRAGACGYLTKHHAFTELAVAIRSVIRGKVYLSSEVAQLVTRGFVTPPLPSRMVTPCRPMPI